MSVRVMSDVWANSQAKGSQLLLLLSIADHSHDDGSGAYPSLGYLARKVRMTKRNVQHLISKLIELGELEVTQHGGPNRTNLYRVKSFHHDDTPITERVISLSPKPSYNHKNIIISKEKTNTSMSNSDKTKQVVDGATMLELFNATAMAGLVARYPLLDIPWEAEKCVVWWREKGKKMKQPRSAFHNWLGKAKPSDNSVTFNDPFGEGGKYDRMLRAKITGRR